MKGRLILMGSGELAPNMVAVHRDGLRAADAEEAIVIDSPFGFQENVTQLTTRICEFFETSLQTPTVVASHRHPSDGPAVLERFRANLAAGRYVFAGPGSPSYALARWAETNCGEVVRGLLAEGATVTLASAAAVTAGLHSIPVYEIYKVGEDPYWLPGLDLTAGFGFSMVVVPHWNNTEGGDHDTSHCYIGTRRFEGLRSELDVGVLGVDEHTAAILDHAEGEMTVRGLGEVTVEGSEVIRLSAGETMPLERLADLVGSVDVGPVQSAVHRNPTVGTALERRDPEQLLSALLTLEEETATDPTKRPDLRTALVDTVDAAAMGLVERKEIVGGYIDLLLEMRSQARSEGDYPRADHIRDRLLDLGIEIHDTADGDTTWSVG